MQSVLSKNIHSMKVMNEVECAYIAGFVDGEGCIGLWREKRLSNKCGFRFHPALEANNTNFEVLYRIREMMGNGRIVHIFNKQPNRKPGYKLQLFPNQIRHILPQIMPYLIIKREQARLVLEYLKTVKDGQKHTFADFPKFEEIYEQCKVLNQRGTPGA